MADDDKPLKTKGDDAAPVRSRWGQARRLEFIDVRLRWVGRVNRSDLVSFFDISVPQASVDLGRYLELAEHNVRYDFSSKTYIATEQFVPIFASAEPSRYLSELLLLKENLLRDDQSFLGGTGAFDTVPTPERRLAPDLFFRVVRSIRERRTVFIRYQSMGHPEPTERVVSPHALAFDGFRWHVRAYCHLRRAYTDFVIGRMLSVEFSDDAAVGGAEDEKWHTFVHLVIRPNPGLSEAQQRVIESDYGMKNGMAEYPCRQALLLYAMKRLGLNPKAPADPSAQHIVLVNHEELASLLER